MELKLPLDQGAIQKILPHRFPFLFVDRITELEPDTRIVGIKNVTADECFLSGGDERALPPTILTEAVAQVGAILILARPENRSLIPLFRGIERVRFRGPIRPGDVVVIEARVKRLRNRMGVLDGRAKVGNRIVAHGTMTFALGSAQGAEA